MSAEIDPWDMVDVDQPISTSVKKANYDPWEEVEVPNEESWWKSTARTALQIPQGIVEASPYGQITGLHSLLSQDVFDPEEMERLKEISAKEGIPFDEEEYMSAARSAVGTIPTVSNIASSLEERYGIPLEPKTRGQKALRFGSMATKAVSSPKGVVSQTAKAAAPQSSGLTFRGLNTNLPAPVLGGGITATKEVLQEMGVPEFITDLAAFGVIKPTSEGAPTFISPQKKPSGMTTRRYEGLTKPTEVSERTLKKIQRGTSEEVRGLAKDIIKETPISESYQKMKEDISYKRGIEEGFNDVQALAEKTPGQTSIEDLKGKIKSKIGKEKGIEVTEASKAKNKILKQFVDDLGEGTISIEELERRYRKNNESARKSYDPGISWDANQANREAHLAYNQAIADIFEEIAPNTEFLKQFRQRNAEWKSLMDAEMVDNFLDQMTKGKIRYEKGKDFFRKNGMDVKFKRALGPDGFRKFETLIKDMLSTEEAASLLQKKADPGLMPYAKKALYFAIDPTLGKAKFGFDLFKGGYNKIFEMLLDKPELAVNWDRGINALKKGEIKVANQELEKVAQAEKEITERQAAVKKYNDHKKEQNSTNQKKQQSKKTT